MDCETTLHKIDDYLKNRLTGNELVEFAEHVEGCPSCRDELSFYYIIDRVTHELDTDDNITYDYNSDLDDDISSILETGRKKSVKKSRAKIFINLGIVILIVIIAILFT